MIRLLAGEGLQKCQQLVSFQLLYPLSVIIISNRPSRFKIVLPSQPHTLSVINFIKMSSHDKSDLLVVHEFLRQLNIESLCDVASARRQGLPCSPKNHTFGGFNIIQELVFEDGTTWLARIPRPDTCFQPEEATLSYASVLRYLKKHSNIPVPTVFHYAASSDGSNKLGISYLLMNKLPGHALPTLDYGEVYREPWPSELRKAKKVHEQLTDIIIELGKNSYFFSCLRK